MTKGSALASGKSARFLFWNPRTIPGLDVLSFRLDAGKRFLETSDIQPKNPRRREGGRRGSLGCGIETGRR